MVDATDLVIVATLVQTTVITLTLLVFIFQFRSQEKALKESSYQNLLGRYNDFMMSFVGSPQMAQFYSRRFTTDGKQAPSPEEAAVYGQLMIAIGIVEEAHALYRKGWINSDNWQQWATWLKALSVYPEFEMVKNISRGTFDKEFEDLILGMVSESKPSPTQKK